MNGILYESYHAPSFARVSVWNRPTDSI